MTIDLDRELVRMLSVRQPWADFITATPGTLLYAGLVRRVNVLARLLPKNVENRTWSTDWRGTLLVHASSRPDWAAMKAYGLKPSDFVYGAVVGTAELVDVVVNHTSPWAETDMERIIYHWVLGKPRRLTHPVVCPGHLGLRRPAPDILRSALAELAPVGS